MVLVPLLELNVTLAVLISRSWCPSSRVAWMKPEARSQKPGEGGLSFSSATSQLWHFLPLGLSTLILKGGCWVISKVLLELIPLYYRTMFRDSGNTCPSQTSDSGQERVLSSTITPVPNAQPLSRASSTGISISQECPV